MAIKPTFITGANAKICIGDKVLAFATDVSYNVDVINFPVEVIGRYEVVSNEPLEYRCSGSFTVVRYTEYAKAMIGSTINGNTAKNMNPIGDQLNPQKLMQSETFTLAIYQRYGESATSSSLEKVITIDDCRANRRGGSLRKGGILLETYAFVGILAGEGVSSSMQYSDLS